MNLGGSRPQPDADSQHHLSPQAVQYIPHVNFNTLARQCNNSKVHGQVAAQVE
jgi:hypothetical protein